MRILVVEDEKNVGAFIEQGLTEEGDVVDAVADGALALDYAANYQYDLILLDVLLPGVDGRQVARTLRQRGVTTPILMLTALDAVDDRVAGLDSGARLSGETLCLSGNCWPVCVPARAILIDRAAPMSCRWRICL